MLDLTQTGFIKSLFPFSEEKYRKLDFLNFLFSNDIQQNIVKLAGL